jgi:chromosome segregation ATPase
MDNQPASVKEHKQDIQMDMPMDIQMDKPMDIQIPEEKLSEQGRIATAEAIRTGVDRVEELDKQLMFKENKIQAVQKQLKTMEDEVVMIKRIKVSSENLINIMQRVYDRGSVQNSDSAEMERISKEIGDLEHNLNERYWYIDDMYETIEKLCEMMKTMTNNIKTQLDDLVCPMAALLVQSSQPTTDMK